MDSTCLQDHDKNHSQEVTANKTIIESLSKTYKEQATLTDQIICNCDCDEIAKYKEKAHKSFMQVVYNMLVN